MKSNEDILYHRMIYGLQEYEVHIEFYPDFISAILDLMGIQNEADINQLTDHYTAAMGGVRQEVSVLSSNTDQLAKKCSQLLSAK